MNKQHIEPIMIRPETIVERYGISADELALIPSDDLPRYRLTPRCVRYRVDDVIAYFARVGRPELDMSMRTKEAEPAGDLTSSASMPKVIMNPPLRRAGVLRAEQGRMMPRKTRWTDRGFWSGGGSAPIDLVLPGIQHVTGGKQDRIKISSKTRDRRVYDRRVAMIRDLHGRLLFEPLRLLAKSVIDIQELEIAYRQGEPALAVLGDQAGVRSLVALLDAWSGTLTIRTASNTTTYVRRFVDWLGKGATAKQLTAQSINDFLASLTVLRTGNRRIPLDTGKPASPGSRNRARAAIQSFCTWLALRGEMRSSPFAVRRAVKRYAERQLNAGSASGRLPELEAAEMDAYLNALEADRDGSPEVRLVQWAEIETGADVGEFHDENGLRVRHIRFAQDNQTLTRLRFIRTKTAGAVEREIPVTDALAAALREHISLWDLGPDDLVFGMVPRWRAFRVHSNAMHRIGRPGITRKDLRHIAAIRWRRAGADLEQIREWLGHSSIEQTRIYAAFRPDDAYDAPVIRRIERSSRS